MRGLIEQAIAASGRRRLAKARQAYPDDPELASITRQMFLIAPEPREQAIIAHGNFVGLPDDEKRVYENRIVTFFLLRLPATGKTSR